MQSKSIEEESINLNLLLYRRQYVIGPRAYIPNQYWQSVKLNDQLYLSVHQDLPFVIERKNGELIAFIGIAFDPFHPEYEETNILESLFAQTEDLESLIEATTPLVGRWVIYYQKGESSYLFNDTFGYRQIFYYQDGDEKWCASQPELIREQCRLDYESDPLFLDFLQSSDVPKMEYHWYGNQTLYKNCFHLIPNNYLNINTFQQIRFFPNKPIPVREIDEVVDESADILIKIFAAITNRYNVKMPITAGWDSRLLLAASKNFRNKIEYFNDRFGFLAPDFRDVWVPKEMDEKLSLNIDFRNTTADLPAWFVSLLGRNVTGGYIFPKNRMIFDKLIRNETTLNLNGVGGEIVRNFFDRHLKQDQSKITIEEIVPLLGFQEKQPYVEKQLTEWASQLNLSPEYRYTILDLMVWEQTMGNWGAIWPAQQDIAVEEIHPFNCRLLLNVMMACPIELRTLPRFPLFREIIRKLWPELLEIPINPDKKPDRKTIIRQKIHTYIRKIIPKDEKSS